MNAPEILTCLYCVISILAGFYLCYRWGYINGRGRAFDECKQLAAEQYKLGHKRGHEAGYTRGRAEGYEDGRRYEAVTHHNERELERELAKGLGNK